MVFRFVIFFSSTVTRAPRFFSYNFTQGAEVGRAADLNVGC